MSLPKSATPEQVESTRAWVREFYKTINSPNIKNWLDEYFQPNATLTIGNTPSLQGHEAIATNIDKERDNLSNIKHELVHVDVFEDRIYVQLKDTLIVKNDTEQKEIILKSIAVIWKKVDEDKLSSMNIYLDPAPLLERIKMFASKEE